MNCYRAVLAAVLIVSQVGMAGDASAATVGEARVETFLGEPLRIRLMLSSRAGEELDENCVQIASLPGRPAAYLGDLVNAQMEFRPREGGGEVLITTRRPYSEPILVLPLRIGCPPGGLTYREFTFLIDPPGLPAPVVAAALATPTPKAALQRGTVTAGDGSGGRWEVRSGQTLSGIIVATGLDGGDRRRRRELIDAVVEANPGVFRGRGPDYLPAGATLVIPGWSGAPAMVPSSRPAPRRAPRPAPAATPPPAPEYRLQLSAPDTVTAPTTPIEQIERGVSQLGLAAEQDRADYLALNQRLERLKREAAELEVTAQRLTALLEELRGTAPPKPDAVTPAAVEAAGEAASTATATAPAATTMPPSTARVTPAPTTATPEEWWKTYALPLGLAAIAVVLLAMLLARRGRGDGEDLPISAVTPRVARPAKSPPASAQLVPAEPPPAERMEPYLAEHGAPASEIGVEDIDSLLEQAEVLLLFGEPGDAIELLQRHLESTAADAAEPRPWMKLLQILRADGQQAEFEAVSSRFTRQFNIERPRWETFAPGVIGLEDASLEESSPRIIEHLMRVWGDRDETLGFLDSLIVDDRDGARVGFAHGVASEFLFLRDIAREAMRGGTAEA